MADSNAAQELEIWNPTSSVLEVYVEMNPDRYLLQPGDKMVITAHLNGAPFNVQPFEGGGGLQIYPGNDSGPPVTINGLPVEPDWDTKI
jgi:hypothetical protein